MLAHWMTAGIALLTFSACSPDEDAGQDLFAPTTLEAKRFTDEDGNTVTIRLDASAADAMVVTGKDGQRLPIYEYDLAQVSMCLPRSGEPADATAPEAAKAGCKPTAPITQGALFKVASCICHPFGDKLKCYGSTCSGW